MNWRRAGWQLAALIPFGLVFTMGSCAGTIAAFEAGRPARLGHTRPVTRGQAARAASLTTPLGASNAAAWIGRVGRWERSGKSRFFHVYCTLAEIDGMEIDGLRLDGWSRDRGRFSMRTTPYDDGFATVDLPFDADRSGATPPERVKQACPSGYPSDAAYDEEVLPVGERLEVASCREQDRLVPCGDGADVITAGLVKDRFDEARARAGSDELFSILFGGFGLMIVALLAARERPMLDRGKARVR